MPIGNNIFVIVVNNEGEKGCIFEDWIKNWREQSMKAVPNQNSTISHGWWKLIL